MQCIVIFFFVFILIPLSPSLSLSPLLQLNTEWAQVEVIDLINDGSGLGFGIIGGKSTGVVVKTILPGGVADRVSVSFSSSSLTHSLSLDYLFIFYTGFRLVHFLIFTTVS